MLAVTTSIVVALALALHAVGEGMALGALLGSEQRHPVRRWVLMAALSPAPGAVAVSLAPIPEEAHPLLYALLAGVLLRASWIAAKLASGTAPHRRMPGLPALAILIGSALATAMVAIAV